MTYSQGREEEVLLRFFGNFKGRFLDVGAYDGINLSNTRRLAELGWGGTLVDASPMAYRALLRNYAGRTDVECVLAAVVSSEVHEPTITLHESADALSTTNENNWVKWEKTANFHQVVVPAISPSELLLQCPAPYHFISIDTEGTSVEVAKAMPIEPNLPQAICVEHDGHYEELLQHFKDGWSVIHLDDLNLILGRR